MRRTVVFAAILVAFALLTPAGAQAAQKSGAWTAGEHSSQARPRLRVYPGRRLLYRDCDFWLAQEWRPSGPVIVPRQRCWWVRG
jgi:hypothetical protein